MPRPGATWLAGCRPGDAAHSGKEASYVKAAGPAAEPGCSEPRRARSPHERSSSRSLGAHGPSRARPPAWRRSVAPSPARSEHGAPTLKSALMAGEGRGARSSLGDRARREVPRPEAESGGYSALGSSSPARLGNEPPIGAPRPPRAEKLPVGCGEAERAAAWGPGWHWRPARRCAGDSAREEAAALGSPAPLCRRHGGSAELRRGPRPDTERGGPTSSRLPSRARGRGATAVLQDT